jgi:spermidine synthase
LFVLLWATQPKLRSAQLRRDGVSATIGVVAIAAYLGPNYLIDTLTWRYPGEKLVIEETDDATFMVLQYDDEVAGRFQQLVVNGTSYANNRPEGRRYMGLLAHLPLLLHEDPKETVVICVGTGTTIGAASIHDRSDVVWSVDVTRHIYKYVDYFAPKNQAFHKNPKVRQVAADGRDFLQTTDATFDVLTFEPPPPIESGVVNLYSLEFYRAADERMRDGGLVVQWIPFHQGFEEVHRMLIRTMAEVYPHVSLWVPDRHEGILIGSHEPLRIDPARVAAAMAEPDVAESLRDIGVYSVEDLLATFVSADDDLRAFVGDADLVTDGHPRVEYFFGYENRPFHMTDVLAHATPLDRVLVGAPLDPDALARSREVVRLLWEATEGEYGKDPQRSVTALEQAAALAPDNAYVAYRLAFFRKRLAER